MKTKICPKCTLTLPIESFNKNKTRKDGYNGNCKECNKNYLKDHYSRNKDYYVKKASKNKRIIGDWFRSYKKTLKCSKCGDSRWYVLDFHHERDKDTIVSTMHGQGKSKNSILEEIKKCSVLCSNCHRELHFKEKAMCPIAQSG